MAYARSDDVELLRFIADFHAGHGYPPSVSQVADRFELPRSSAQAKLRSLRERGLLSRPDGRAARAIVITEPGMKLLRDPLLEL